MSPLERVVFDLAEDALREEGVACVAVASDRMPPPKLPRVDDVPNAKHMKSRNERGVGSCVAYTFATSLDEGAKKQVEAAITTVFPGAAITWQFADLGAVAVPNPKSAN